MRKDSAARAVARAMEWRGARGGWIYTSDRQPLAAGWYALADRLEVQAWIVDRGPGRGWEIDWPRVPAPGTIRPRADRPLEPAPGGPPHPGGAEPPPTVRLPRTIPGGRGAVDRWAFAPAVDCVALAGPAAALATIAAYQAALAAGIDPAQVIAAEGMAAARAADLAAATGGRWKAVRLSPQPIDRGP